MKIYLLGKEMIILNGANLISVLGYSCVIYFNGGTQHTFTFNTPEEAAQMRDEIYDTLSVESEYHTYQSQLTAL